MSRGLPNPADHRRVSAAFLASSQESRARTMAVLSRCGPNSATFSECASLDFFRAREVVQPRHTSGTSASGGSCRLFAHEAARPTTETRPGEVESGRVMADFRNGTLALPTAIPLTVFDGLVQFRDAHDGLWPKDRRTLSAAIRFRSPMRTGRGQFTDTRIDIAVSLRTSAFCMRSASPSSGVGIHVWNRTRLIFAAKGGSPTRWPA